MRRRRSIKAVGIGGASLLGLVLASCSSALPRHTVAAVKLHVLASPQNDYTIAVPDGWRFTPGLPGGFGIENPIMLSPPGKTQPTVLIWGLLSVSDAASSECAGPVSPTDPNYADRLIRCQFNAMSGKWKATDAVQVIGAAFGGYGISTQIVNNGGQSDTDAQATVRTTFQGKHQDQLWMVSMQYHLNPAITALALGFGLTNTTEWDSFAFLSACASDPGKLSSAERDCVAVLRSFRPSAGWLRNEIQRYLDNLQHQVHQVGQTLSNIQRMENQQQLQAMAADQRVYRGWWNVLGGTTDLRAPNGDVYSTDATNRYYCLTPGSGILGTDDPAVLQGTDCKTTLTPISPPG